MPFTPFHMGPAATFKLVGGDRFSFTVFGYSQILMDLEPLVRLLRGDVLLHGPSHTYAGAAVVGLAAFATAKWPCETGLRGWNHLFRSRWLRLPDAIPWRVIAVSAFIGTFSHVFLDSFMHADMTPWSPVSGARPGFGLLSRSALLDICLVTGIVGGGAWLGLRIWRRLRAERARPRE